MIEKKPHVCYECDSEFFVFPTYEESEVGEISWCPYCGSELEAAAEDIEEEADEYFKEVDDEE